MDSSSNPSSPDSDRGTCCNSDGGYEVKKWNVVDKSKRIRASARERRRRHVLNSALENLRQRVPCVHQNPQKLSKIEVLRLAIDYISMLSYYLENTSPPYFEYDSSDNQGSDATFHSYPVRSPNLYPVSGENFVSHLNLLHDSESLQFLPSDFGSFLQTPSFHQIPGSYICEQRPMYTT